MIPSPLATPPETTMETAQLINTKVPSPLTTDVDKQKKSESVRTTKTTTKSKKSQKSKRDGKSSKDGNSNNVKKKKKKKRSSITEVSVDGVTVSKHVRDKENNNDLLDDSERSSAHSRRRNRKTAFKSSQHEREQQQEQYGQDSCDSDIDSETDHNRIELSSQQEEDNICCKKLVRFDTIQILEFPIILGDNPSVSDGFPVTIDWNLISQTSMDVDVYETLVVQSNLRRNRRLATKLPAATRLEVLFRQGYTISELGDMHTQIMKIQDSRDHCNKNQRFDKFYEAIVMTGQKIKDKITASPVSASAPSTFKPSLLRKDSNTKSDERSVNSNTSRYSPPRSNTNSNNGLPPLFVDRSGGKNKAKPIDASSISLSPYPTPIPSPSSSAEFTLQFPPQSKKEPEPAPIKPPSISDLNAIPETPNRRLMKMVSARDFRASPSLSSYSSTAKMTPKQKLMMSHVTQSMGNLLSPTPSQSSPSSSSAAAISPIDEPKTPPVKARPPTVDVSSPTAPEAPGHQRLKNQAGKVSDPPSQQEGLSTKKQALNTVTKLVRKLSPVPMTPVSMTSKQKLIVAQMSSLSNLLDHDYTETPRPSRDEHDDIDDDNDFDISTAFDASSRQTKDDSFDGNGSLSLSHIPRPPKKIVDGESSMQLSQIGMPNENEKNGKTTKYSASLNSLGLWENKNNTTRDILRKAKQRQSTSSILGSMTARQKLMMKQISWKPIAEESIEDAHDSDKSLLMTPKQKLMMKQLSKKLVSADSPTLSSTSTAAAKTSQMTPKQKLMMKQLSNKLLSDSTKSGATFAGIQAPSTGIPRATSDSAFLSSSQQLASSNGATPPPQCNDSPPTPPPRRPEDRLQAVDNLTPQQQEKLMLRKKQKKLTVLAAASSTSVNNDNNNCDETISPQRCRRRMKQHHVAAGLPPSPCHNTTPQGGTKQKLSAWDVAMSQIASSSPVLGYGRDGENSKKRNSFTSSSNNNNNNSPNQKQRNKLRTRKPRSGSWTVPKSTSLLGNSANSPVGGSRRRRSKNPKKLSEQQYTLANPPSPRDSSNSNHKASSMRSLPTSLPL